MKLKIHYFKILIVSICFLFCNNAMAFYSSNWVDVPTENKDIKKLSLDLASVNEHNNSLYYAVRYYKNEGGGLVVIVQSKGTQAGIVKSYSEYDYNEHLTKEISYPALTPAVAKQFNELTPSSLLYRANLGAMRFVGYNGNLKLGQADFTGYLNRIQKTLKKSWQNSGYYSDIYSKGSGHVELTLKIAYDGRLLKCDVDKTSGNKNFDNNIVNIVKAAQTQMSAYNFKFEPLPTGFTGNSIDLQVIFDFGTKQVTAIIITPNVNVTKTELNTKDNVDFSSYMKDVHKKIKRNWKPPKGNKTKSVTVLFKISKTGELLSCNIFKSSGDQETDNSALKAVKDTIFEPLPKEYSKDNLNMQFTFDYKIFGQD